MNKPKQLTKYLLAIIIGLLLIVMPIVYLYIDASHYNTEGSMWKEFWLPIVCSLQATLLAIFISYLFLESIQAQAEEDRNRALAAQCKIVLEAEILKLESKIEARKDSAHAIIVELLLKHMNSPRGSYQSTETTNSPSGDNK